MTNVPTNTYEIKHIVVVTVTIGFKPDFKLEFFSLNF